MSGGTLEQSLSAVMSATVASHGMIPCCDIQSFMAMVPSLQDLTQILRTKKITSVSLSLRRNQMDHCILTRSILTLDEPFAVGMQVHEFPPTAGYPPQPSEGPHNPAEILPGIDGRGVSDAQQNFSQLESQNNPGGWDVGFDWAFSSEDLFNLLRADSSMPPLPIPLAQYSPETQTSMNHDSGTGTHAVRDNSSSSVDASRQAVRSMNKMIRDLPAGLVAEVESMDKSSPFFEDCLDLFFTHFSPALPLLHKPTFAARGCGSTLLLNILALGSLFVGTKDAVSRVSSIIWSMAVPSQILTI